MTPKTGKGAPIPVYLRASGVSLSPAERVRIRQKLARTLGKFSASVARASVRLEDVNGPRGGIDYVCRIKVVLRALPSVVYEKRGASLPAVIDGALTGVGRAVRRSVQRRRMAPARQRRRG